VLFLVHKKGQPIKTYGTKKLINGVNNSGQKCSNANVLSNHSFYNVDNVLTKCQE